MGRSQETPDGDGDVNGNVNGHGKRVIALPADANLREDGGVAPLSSAVDRRRISMNLPELSLMAETGTIGHAFPGNVGAGAGIGYAIREADALAPLTIDLHLGKASLTAGWDEQGLNSIFFAIGSGGGVSVDQSVTGTYTIENAKEGLRKWWTEFQVALGGWK